MKRESAVNALDALLILLVGFLSGFAVAYVVLPLEVVR